MPVQPNLFPESNELSDPRAPFRAAGSQTAGSQTAGSQTAGSGPSAPPQNAPATPANPAPVWLQRVSLFILVLFCVYLGAIVTVLPWWMAVWDHNLFFTTHPALWAVLRLAPVRGVISGLGLLDIWIGVSEAIHYRDHRP